MRYRAELRTNHLVVKGDTRARYNIISGEDRPKMNHPNPIQKPSSMNEYISPRVDTRRSLQPSSGYN